MQLMNKVEANSVDFSSYPQFRDLPKQLIHNGVSHDLEFACEVMGTPNNEIAKDLARVKYDGLAHSIAHKGKIIIPFGTSWHVHAIQYQSGHLYVWFYSSLNKNSVDNNFHLYDVTADEYVLQNMAGYSNPLGKYMLYWRKVLNSKKQEILVRNVFNLETGKVVTTSKEMGLIPAILQDRMRTSPWNANTQEVCPCPL